MYHSLIQGCTLPIHNRSTLFELNHQNWPMRPPSESMRKLVIGPLQFFQPLQCVSDNFAYIRRQAAISNSNVDGK